MAWQHGPSSEARLNWARKAPPLPICSSSELNVLRILHVCMRMVTLWCMVSTHTSHIQCGIKYKCLPMRHGYVCLSEPQADVAAARPDAARDTRERPGAGRQARGALRAKVP